MNWGNLIKWAIKNQKVILIGAPYLWKHILKPGYEIIQKRFQGKSGTNDPVSDEQEVQADSEKQNPKNIMAEKKEFQDTRKGFLTPEQEKIADDLIEAKGIIEAVDGLGIRIADNSGLQKLKEKLLETKPDVVPVVYDVIDEVFVHLAVIAEAKRNSKK